MIGLYIPPRSLTPALPVFPSPIGGTGKCGTVGLLEFPVSGRFGNMRERVSPTGTHELMTSKGELK